jgi:hypothetical protein
MQVTLNELPPAAELGPDKTICGSDQAILDAGLEGYNYLWSNGATTQSISVDTTGVGYGAQTFWVELTNENNCVKRSDEVMIDFINCTGINENTAINLDVYPNPGDGRFVIDLQSKANQNVQLRVFDANGTVVFEQKQLTTNTGKTELNLTNLPSGSYNLVVDGSIRVSRKLIIKR